MIRLEDLRFKYATKSNESIKLDSLLVKNGEVIVLTGESGCGKSTVLRCINGLGTGYYEGILHGTMIVDECDCTMMSICDISKIISTVLQNPDNQFFTLDVLSDLVFSCENFCVSKQEIQERLNHIIDLLELKDYIGSKFSELSGGEKQKIAIASALMLNTKNLLLDEPSASLDYHSIKMLSKLILTLKSAGYTVIIAEHRLYYLKHCMDHLIVMKNGKIIDRYNKEELETINHFALHDQGIRGIHIFEDDVYQLENTPMANINKIASMRKITFSYKLNQKVLNSIDLDIYAGDRIALIGKNGSGKTTMGKILCGLLKAKSGVIL